jgi:hypothetical protein
MGVRVMPIIHKMLTDPLDAVRYSPIERLAKKSKRLLPIRTGLVKLALQGRKT